MILSERIILILICFLAFFLRIFKISEIPPGFSWDEAAIGYNAYSLIKSGKDEFGFSYPLAFKSFDDYKSPLFIYLAIPFIYFFGLNEFSLRFVSSLIGVLAIFTVYFLTKELVGKDKNFQFSIFNFKINPALLSSFLLAVSPWHLQFSRPAFENNLAFTLMLLGVYFFLKALKKPFYFFFSAFFFILSFYSYHSAKVFLPFFFVALNLIYKKEIFKKRNLKWVLVSFLFSVILLLPLALKHLKGKAGARFQTTSIFFAQNHNLKSRKEIFKQLYQNYIKHFTFNFLFLGSESNYRNKLKNYGLFHLIELPFLIIGFFSLIKKIDKKIRGIVLSWVFLAPLPAALTIEAPHSLRASAMLFPLILLVAFGINTLIAKINKLNETKKNLFLIFILACYVLNFFYYFYEYYYRYPLYSAKDWQYGSKELAQYLKSRENEVEQIIISNFYGQPHIFIQFFQKLEPLSLWGRGKYIFRSINWETDRNLQNVLLVLTAQEINSISNWNSVKIVKEIKFPDGSFAFRVIKL